MQFRTTKTKTFPTYESMSVKTDDKITPYPNDENYKKHLYFIAYENFTKCSFQIPRVEVELFYWEIHRKLLQNGKCTNKNEVV